MAKIALGLDYGTNSVRALAVDVATGEELATAVFDYPSGEAGLLLDPKDLHLARQNPSDYLAGFVSVVRELGGQVDLSQVIGIGVDTTGSSPLPVMRDNAPLTSDVRFRNDPAAHVWLWKDHTSFAEAAEITSVARVQGQPYLAACGGTYSSEWFWSKLLRFVRTSPAAFAETASWVEVCDWIPSVLCGVSDPKSIKRSRCAAGHKAMFEEVWGGLPSASFLNALDPRLSAFRSRLYDTVFTSDQAAGYLCERFAGLTGLREGIPVAVGALDAHVGAVASMVRPGILVKIIGTSTCDCMVHPLNDPIPNVPGLCGIVRGSILPGYYGIEAGQSAVGDIFSWVARLTGCSHDELSDEAAKRQPGETGLLALDWHNGNRTVLVDPLLSGLVVGLTLHTRPADIYRACIEATAFGALRIIDQLQEHRDRIDQVVACGGIAEKSPLTMQIYADVLERPVAIARSEQTCALGSAIFGAVVGGAHAKVEDAQAHMADVRDHVYQPNPAHFTVYRELYRLYRNLHDAFGTRGYEQNLFHVMKRLKALQER